MLTNRTSKLPEILTKLEIPILDDWIKEQLTSGTLRKDLLSEAELRRDSTEFLGLLKKATQSGNLIDLSTSDWSQMKSFLNGISRSRATQGFTPTETAVFIFSLKQSLFAYMQEECGHDATLLANEL